MCHHPGEQQITIDLWHWEHRPVFAIKSWWDFTKGSTVRISSAILKISYIVVQSSSDVSSYDIGQE